MADPAQPRNSSTPPPSSQPSPAAPSEGPHRLESQRRANRDAVVGLGLSPYGQRTEGIVEAAAAKGQYDVAADQEQQERGKEPGFVDRRPLATVAGRVMLYRDQGKLIWLQVRDQ